MTKLHLADIHLTAPPLWNAEFGVRNEETKYPWEFPAAAEKLINPAMRDGYQRRDQELAAAKKAILGS